MLADPETSDATGPSKPAPGLYLTAVPIGNAGDITLRALRLLATVDTVACEDTRVTGKLLGIYGIKAALLPYHDHNAERMRPAIVARIAAGESVALVADAGTPLISDPGFKLVAAVRAAGLAVTCLPGASAPLVALLLSGLPSDRFLFAGFPPARAAARRAVFAELAAVPATLVFFESAARLADSLADLAAVLGDRQAVVARELTKLFEEVRSGRLAELAAHYAAAGPPKGEIVVVVGPPPSSVTVADDAEIERDLRAALARASLRDAVAEIAAIHGRARREIYRQALALTDRGHPAAGPDENEPDENEEAPEAGEPDAGENQDDG